MTPEEQRDEAMERVEQNANRRSPGFTEHAIDTVLQVLKQSGPLHGEQITNKCKEAGVVPHNDKAFGPVYLRLSRAGIIKKIGFAPRGKGHLTAGGIIWDLA